LLDAYGEKVGLEIWDRFTVHYTPKHSSWLNRPRLMRIPVEVGHRFRCDVGQHSGRK